MKLDDKNATIFEKAHAGFLICYAANPIGFGAWRLSIVRDGASGHYPISEDLFLGSREDAYAEAERLNRERLKLPVKSVMDIIAGSMRNWR